MSKITLVALLVAGCAISAEPVTRIEAARMVASEYCALEDGDGQYACESGVVRRTCGAGCDERAIVSNDALERCLFDIAPSIFPASCIALF